MDPNREIPTESTEVRSTFNLPRMIKKSIVNSLLFIIFLAIGFLTPIVAPLLPLFSSTDSASLAIVLSIFAYLGALVVLVIAPFDIYTYITSYISVSETGVKLKWAQGGSGKRLALTYDQIESVELGKGIVVRANIPKPKNPNETILGIFFIPNVANTQEIIDAYKKMSGKAAEKKDA